MSAAAERGLRGAHVLQVEISGLSADYGARRVIADLSLTLAHGQTLVVAGANGSGKSTLLRTIAGLQRPSAGSVRVVVDGAVYAPQRASHLIGWVAPDLMLYRELTAAENLTFFARVRGVPTTPASIAELLAEVGLAGRGDDLLAAYSSGMAQRLRYAYALLHRPPLLLLDEPTLALDERGVAVVERVVAAQRERGIAIIATNDAREERFGDLVLRLSA